ncbi:hypothetical protein Chor_008665 [Crotalus horridus]
MEINNFRTSRFSVRGWRFLPGHHIYTRISLQASKGYLSNKNLSLQH